MNSTKLSFPWGTEDLFVHNEVATVKILYVKKNEALSLQYHHHRNEFWKILSGNPEVIVGEETFSAKAGDEFNILVNTKHRITAKNDNVAVLEISTGDFDENDIVHLEDKYGRVT